MKDITVIMPIYNVEKYLEDSLKSIINQTLKNIEIICVNDGSTDRSMQILELYAKQDDRIKIISQSNRGLSASRNVGIDVASGKYIHFMDSDDMMKLDAYETIYQKASTHDLDILYFDACCIYDSDALKKQYEWDEKYYIRKDIYQDIYDGKQLFIKFKQNNDYCVQQCMQLVKLDFIKKHQIKYYEGIYHEDNLFSFVSILLARKVSHIPQRFFIRRIRENSIITQELNFDHCYGYFISFIEIFKFARQLQCNDRQLQLHMKKEIQSKLWNARKIFGGISTEEQQKFSRLSLLEQYIFQLFIINSHNDDEYILLHEELAAIKRSGSFRLGRLITYIPRKIRDYFKR